MATLTINGVNLSGVVASTDDPKGDRRDVGEQYGAVDGTLRVTRQARKRDLSFKTIPLTDANAHTWESFFIGEGEVWSFDSSLYGSKGLGPVTATGNTIGSSSPSPKFGAGRLKITNGNSFTLLGGTTNIFGGTANWTASVWRSTGGAWSNYIVRSDGAKWVDGVRNDAASTTWLVGSGGNLALANAEGADRFYDDLVVLPFSVLDTWPPIFGVATTAFPPLPYLDIAGDLVPEQSTRRVLGQVTESLKKVAGGQRHVLDVKLTAK